MKIGNLRFDLLKVLSLFLIFLAHSYTPETNNFAYSTLFQLRNFDVPLMVMVSGAVFSSSRILKPDYSYFNYTKRRITRIVKPVWLFLIFYFCSGFMIFKLINKPFIYGFDEIKDTFLLIEGIGFVWIFRVFCLIAIIAPLLIKLYNRISNAKIFIGLIFSFYLIYEFLVNFICHYAIPDFINLTLFYLIPYSIMFSLGIALPRLNTKTILFISIIFLIFFTSILSYNVILNLGNISQILELIYTQRYKFAPKLYYLSYAIFMSLICYLLVKNIDIKRKVIVRAITFISSFSMSIYLWHIFVIFLKNLVFPELNSVLLNFIIISACSILITYIQTITNLAVHKYYLILSKMLKITWQNVKI